MPLRTTPKLLFRPFTTFQLKSEKRLNVSLFSLFRSD